jgi:ketosteroid isomerase-like protein
MSQGNVDLVRGGFEAFNRRDREASEAVLHPDVEWDLTGVDAPGLETVYRGHAGVREFWRTWFSELDNVRFEVDELIDAGDRVLVAMRWVGRGHLSGAQPEQHVFNVYTLRDGLIVRIQSFVDRMRALTAAGLHA